MSSEKLMESPLTEIGGKGTTSSEIIQEDQMKPLFAKKLGMMLHIHVKRILL